MQKSTRGYRVAFRDPKRPLWSTLDAVGARGFTVPRSKPDNEDNSNNDDNNNDPPPNKDKEQGDKAISLWLFAWSKRYHCRHTRPISPSSGRWQNEHTSLSTASGKYVDLSCSFFSPFTRDKGRGERALLPRE